MSAASSQHRVSAIDTPAARSHVAHFDVSTKTLNPAELAAVSESTLRHYAQHAVSFWDGTRGHDVSQNVQAFLEALGEQPGQQVLDFGCGPGRDLAEFTRRGHVAVGLDGCEAFVHMASEHSGARVLHQDFLALSLPDAGFDGVFANASLFHVPTQELPRVLGQLWRCLRPGGVLFSSNPRGENQEGYNGARYGAYHDEHRWRELVSKAGFEALAQYYRPEGLPRESQPWLATLWRKRAVSPLDRP